MPDAFELPRVLGAIIPLMSARKPFVLKFITDGLPGFSSIFGALYHLPKPAAGLRCINAIRLSRGTLKVINFPAAEMWTADFPLLSLAVGSQDESSFPRTNQNSCSAHNFYLSDGATNDRDSSGHLFSGAVVAAPDLALNVRLAPWFSIFRSPQNLNCKYTYEYRNPRHRHGRCRTWY